MPAGPALPVPGPPQGPGSKSKGHPAPALVLTAPHVPTRSDLLFSSSLPHWAFILLLLLFLI